MIIDRNIIITVFDFNSTFLTQKQTIVLKFLDLPQVSEYICLRFFVCARHEWKVVNLTRGGLISDSSNRSNNEL